MHVCGRERGRVVWAAGVRGRAGSQRGATTGPAVRRRPPSHCANCVAGRSVSDLQAPRLCPFAPPCHMSPSHDGRPVCPVQMGEATVACQGDSLRSVVPGAAQDSGVTRKTSVRRDLGGPSAEEPSRAADAWVCWHPSSVPAGWGFWSGAYKVTLPEVSFFPHLGKKKPRFSFRKACEAVCNSRHYQEGSPALGNNGSAVGRLSSNRPGRVPDCQAKALLPAGVCH